MSININRKLEILSAAAKYDVSCSSSGSSRKNGKGLGSAHSSGICHSFAADGRCISLLKILLTNDCIYDCSYCLNRRSQPVERASFSDDEIVGLTINFYLRNYIEGLFLSSAIEKSPDHTMERLGIIVKRLRERENFHGYIHLKAIPGADRALIEQAGRYVDRLSVNIELPTNESLRLLAPQKKKEAILGSMKYIHSSIADNRERKRLFVPAGQSTQLIIGASPENDEKILTLSQNLYSKMKLKRVFYSAFVPVTRSSLLPQLAQPPLVRENRLYQADWLLRFYKFKAEELFSDRSKNLPEDIDPKTNWAFLNYHLFPVDINSASYEMILRVPGIGVRGAKRIISARRMHRLAFDDLKTLGIVLKRAQYFIRTDRDSLFRDDVDRVRELLTPRQSKYRQLLLFDKIVHSSDGVVQGEF